MKSKAIGNLLVLILTFLSILNLQGQGWVKFYGNDDVTQIGYSVVNTPDSGFLLGGFEISDNDKIIIFKTDSLGNEEWTTTIESSLPLFSVEIQKSINNTYLIFPKTTPGSGFYVKKIFELNIEGDILSESELNCQCSALTQGIDGNFVGIETILTGINFETDIKIIKFDTDGNITWSYIYDFYLYDSAQKIIRTADDGFLISGQVPDGFDISTPLLLKIDSDGNEMWSIIDEYSLSRYISSISETQDNNFLIAIADSNSWGLPNNNLIFQKIDENGELIWERRIGEPLFDETIKIIKEAQNGDILMIGYSQSTNPLKYFFVRTNSQGALIQKTEINVLPLNYFNDFTETTGNSVVVLGYGIPVSDANFQLVKIDSSGNIFTNILEGNAFQDFNLNCELNAVENGFSNQLIKADGILDFYTFTDSIGNYSMLLDSGNYEIKLHSPNPYWQSCAESYSINFPDFSDTIALNLPMLPVIECPLLITQISNNTLRPCPLPNKIIVQYCNEGTVTAEAALLEVTLNEYMAVDSISIDPTAITGDLYTFELGDLAPFDCGQITFHFQLECDSVQLGQTLCAEAHIYPDTLCLDPIWTGPVISVDGQCHPDSITFIIENEGDDMPDPQQYIIIEDNIILLQEPYQLMNGETEEITIPKMDNATYFILAQQSPNLPSVLGNNYATFAIENCEALPFTSIFNQFPLDDAEPYFDEFCREVTGSYDPNDKQGFPTGFGEDHQIEQNVDLDYLIRFQNTGTDTAFTVIIRDNLSEFLDLTTLRPGASSHDYNLEIVNGRTLKFTFNNILLPDSTTNEAASHGWVEFHIAQVLDNPIGTVINNRADIYFDGNAPILTNTTEHLIGEDFIDIIDNATQIFRPNVELKVYPNPANKYAIFELENIENSDLVFKLFNAMGQIQMVDNFSENAYQFYRNDLMAGMYYFQIEGEGKLIVTGKLVLK